LASWTSEEWDDLSLSWEDFRERHPDRTFSAYRTQKYMQSKGQVKFCNKPDPTQEQSRKYFDTLIDAAAQKRQLLTQQARLSVSIDDDRPIAIAYTGDWHSDQMGCRHDLLQAHNDLLASCEGVYLIGMGDYFHNAKSRSKTGDSLYSSVFPDPEDQRAFVLSEMRKCKGKWIGLIRGCHESFSDPNGTDEIAPLCKELECANLWHGGILHLQVKDETYVLGARHRYPGGAGVNSTNSQRRFYDDYPEEDHLDVIAHAHYHFCDLQKRVRRGRQCVYLRSGSYLDLDPYGQKLAGYGGEPGVPLTILFPDRHLVVPFAGPDLEIGLEVLSHLRALNR
jgi:hypothetical protein